MKEMLLYQDAKEEGRQEGREEGEVTGISKGEAYFAQLSEILLKNNRTEDLLKATTDVDFRRKLYEEFSITP